MAGFLPKVRRYMFSQKTMMLYTQSIKDVASMDIRCAEGLLCRELLPRDRGTFAKLLGTQRKRETLFQPVFGMEDVEERVARGEHCFVCEDGERIAGDIWFSPREKFILEIKVTLQLQDGDVYAYNAYVDEEYRGRNITPSILVAACRVLLPAGFTRLLLVTMDWNESTHRTLKKAKFLCKGNLTAGYFATIRFMINTCGDIDTLNNAGPFELYGKLFRKVAAALSGKGATARPRMV